MTAHPLRKDAARNRERILRAAQSISASGAELQLNDVARHAEVGVGTVYRHFPTVGALRESLADARFEALIGEAERAGTASDLASGVRAFLLSGLEAAVDDTGFAAVLATGRPVRAETRELRMRLLAASGALLAAAGAAGITRPGILPNETIVLLCGVAHALTIAGARDRATIEHYLDVIMEGLLVH